MTKRPKIREIIALRHVENEPLGLVGEALARAGCQHRYVDVYRGEAVPSHLTDDQGLVVLGGPMGVYEADQHPFLREEMQLIERCVGQDRPVLGICLGAQLVAGALGAKVYPGSQGPEFGWGTVNPTPLIADDPVFSAVQGPMMVAQWHGDTFDLPNNAAHLWSSDKYRNQGFRVGRRTYALQFHLELTPEILEDWIARTPDEVLARGGSSQAAYRAQTHTYGPLAQALAREIFDRWLHL